MTKEQDIERINQVYSKFGLSVYKTIESVKINQYRIKLPIDIDVKKLLKLESNLVIALEEKEIRVYQDVADLVIEKKVSDKILEAIDVFKPSFFERKRNLRLILGKDMSGNNVITQLIKAPHMIVAGCTGSGKTQLLHCFIASILSGNDTVTLILIDPKGNEFNVYKNIDTVQFVTDTTEAIHKLNWLCYEMDNRYKIMAEKGVSDISGTDLTRIVCIIDEFADLIKQDRTVEKYVVRLAQKARACGIHLIIGTQYPVRDVVTGLIQANVPARVCLKVNSNTQSRVVLGVSGGEKLIGHGDLLYLGNGMYEPIRIQAPFMSEEAKKSIASKSEVIFKGKGSKPQPINQQPQYQPEQKKPGFFQGLKNIFNSQPNMTTDEFTAIHYMRK